MFSMVKGVLRGIGNRFQHLLLTAGFGAFLIGAAVLKFYNPDPWAAYVPGWFLQFWPYTPVDWMHVSSAVEAVLGAVIIVGWKRWIAALLATGWLAGVTFAVYTVGVFDVFYRDLGLVIWGAAVTLRAVAD